MAKSKTTWKPGQSGNPSGRPRSGEGIIKALADEFNRGGQKDKLARKIVEQALSDNADWRLMIAVYEFFFKIWQHEYSLDLEKRMDELQESIESIKLK